MDVSTYGNSGFVSVIANTSLGVFEHIAPTPYAGRSFVGFVLDAGETLSFLRVENVAGPTGGVGNDNFIIDNFTFGTHVPPTLASEPSSWALLGLPMLILLAKRRRS